MRLGTSITSYSYKKSNLKNGGILLSSLFFLILSQSFVYPATAAEVQNETHDRNVDQVALLAQDSAIQKLKKLINKYQNTPQEALLLMRLSEVYQQSATIQFRIAHGRAHQNKTKVQLDKYQSYLKASITSLDRLIQSYTDFESLDQCYFMRGHAYEDLELKSQAKKDYLHLVTNYPDSAKTIPAYMALAQMAIDANNHPEAITYLVEVEKSPDSPYFPFALYKLAWSHFNLKEIPKALNYIEKHVRFYDDLNKKETGLSSSDAAVRENSLMDSVAFYIEGNEQGLSQYSRDLALKYFRNLDDGPLLGKMTLRFAKLLRTHRREDDLVAWKAELIEKEKLRPETADVVMVAFDYQMNQSKFEDMITSAKDLVYLYSANDEPVRNSESYTLARKDLIETATKLREMTLKNKNATQVSTLMKTLSEVYTAFIHIVPEEDPRVSQAHYNLAETLFVIHEYDKATDHYRWVLIHWNKKNGLVYSDIELKAIASRYETLRADKLIPQELTPAKLDNRTDKDLTNKLQTQLLEWIGWIDWWSGKPDQVSEQTKTALENFQFEANRSIYKNGSTKIATERMILFAMRSPESKFAIPSATLAIDTYIISEEWKESYLLAKKLLKKKWNSDSSQNSFEKKLKEIAENSSYKMVEQKFNAKLFEESIQDAEKLMKEFPGGIRSGDCLVLMAQASIALKKKPDAEKYYSRLILEFPNSKDNGMALLARAQLAEESYRYSQAAQDYESFLKIKTDETQEKRKLDIQKRIYFLRWIMGTLKVECANQKDKDEDDDTEINIECQKYLALSWLKDLSEKAEIDSDQAKKFVKSALKGPKENRPLWAAVALKFSIYLEYRDRLVMIRVLSNGWEKLEPLVRFSLIPFMSQVIPDTLSLARIELKKVVPLNKATTQSITRRVEWIKEIETTATKALVLPWGKIRALSLLELSLVYLDFSKTLADLPLPKELSDEEAKEYKKTVQEIIDPFTAKGRDIAQRAYQVASESAVESSVLGQISTVYPEFAKVSTDQFTKKIPSYQQYFTSIGLDLPFLERLSNGLDQKNLPEVAPVLKKIWLEAYTSRAWTRAGFILQEIQEKKAAPPALLKTMRAMTLISLGAQAEGLLELQSASEDYDPLLRNQINTILASFYTRALSLDNSLRLIQSIEKYKASLVKGDEKK